MSRPLPELTYHSRETAQMDEEVCPIDSVDNPYMTIFGGDASGNGDFPRAEAAPFRIPENVNTTAGILPPAPGFAHPVENMRLMRGFDGADCWHQGVDIGGHGPMGGVGQPVRAMVKAKIIFIGTPESDSRKFGRRDRRRGFAKRRNYKIPRRLKVKGYPTVYPLTRNLGSSRTGVFMITEAQHPRIEDYHVRYMHLAAVRPGLEVGDVVEPGEELGLMGATAILVSAPHVHIDIENPKGVRVNPARFLGLDKVLSGKCRPINKRATAQWRRHKRRLRRRRR